MTALLCVHGHFYQPPREDPFRGLTPREAGAEPYHDFNEKITAECYRPNAEMGNFGRLSFDVGPTLASWLAERAPETLELIAASERAHVEAHGVSNALAQPYVHAILPLATRREKRLQVAWGVADYAHRFGRAPEGMWLPETAVDLETLRALADHGVTYTVLAQWQAAGPIDPTEPYWVELGDGRRRDRAALGALVEGQYYRQLMMTSCGFFFEDLDRIEPRNNIAFAARAIACLPRETRRVLTDDFMADLTAARSWRTGRTGADIFRGVLDAARDAHADRWARRTEPSEGDERTWKVELEHGRTSPGGSPVGSSGCRS